MSLFIRKLFSRDKEPKTPASGLDVTRSMIDFINDDFDPDASFRSHQPRLDRTFSGGFGLEADFSHRTNTVESLNDFPTRKPKLTITSALNTPKRGSLIEDLYNAVQEQVIEQLGGIFYGKKEPVLSPKLLKQVQQRDFDLYISRLRKVFEVYKRNMEVRLEHKHKEEINMAASLLKCYEMVPGQYFDENFVFNFNYLVKDRGLILHVQEDLSEYLDVVEINLYHQVTNKFEEYLDMMLKINSMEAQIQNSLYSVRFFRNMNHELRNKFSNRTQMVLKQKRRTLNIEKTLALIDLINIVKKTLPTLVHLIKKNNFESAVKIVKTSEDIYKTKLKQVKALKNFNVNFGEARNTLEKLLTTEFEERCVNYFTPALLYNKPQPDAPKDSLSEENFMNIINIGEGSSEVQTAHVPLYWTLEKFAMKLNVEKDITKIVVEYIKIKDFPLTVYKGKLLEVMKKFHKKFMSDVTELVESLAGHQNHKQGATPVNMQKSLPFELHLKLILFYFEVFKRFIGEHFNLNCRILTALIEYYSENFVEKGNAAPSGYSTQRVLDTKAMKDLNETVQEFYLTLAMIFKYFNDRLAEVINLRSFENISIQQFTQLVAVFERIVDHFQSNLRIEERLNSWIVTDKEGIKKPLLRLVSSLSDKITISPIQSLMIEIERGFLNVHHKRQLETLKTSLEQENWQAVDIPQEYNEYFEIFFRPTPKAQINKNMFGSDIGSTESSSPSYEATSQDQGTNQEQDHQGKKETFFKFEKNEFYLQGKRFQVTSSFLLLIQTLYDYFQIAYRFRFIELDAIAKIFETIKFYNSYTIQLVLGAGATAFGKIPRITAKILGISSISLCLLVQLIDPLYENISKQDNKMKIEWLNHEVMKVKEDLNTHINEIGAKVRSILKSKLVEQSGELKKINWASAQEKIVAPSKFTTNILTNTKQMYKQIQVFLLKEQLVAIARGILEDMKNNYLPVFEGINVETRIAAKRVKDELQHFNDELYQIPIFQEPEVNYSDFEDRILSVIEDKCNHFLEITSIN